MTLRFIAATVLVVACSYPAAGQSSNYSANKPAVTDENPLKVRRPDTIKVLYAHGVDCPGDKDSIDERIDGLLIRSRLKRSNLPIDRFMGNPISLVVSTSCGNSPGEVRPFIYNVVAGFRETVKVERELVHVITVVYHNPFAYGFFGVVGTRGSLEEKVRQTVRDTVEKALTDYLKANFDL